MLNSFLAINFLRVILCNEHKPRRWHKFFSLSIEKLKPTFNYCSFGFIVVNVNNRTRQENNSSPMSLYLCYICSSRESLDYHSFNDLYTSWLFISFARGFALKLLVAKLTWKVSLEGVANRRHSLPIHVTYLGCILKLRATT